MKSSEFKVPEVLNRKLGKNWKQKTPEHRKYRKSEVAGIPILSKYVFVAIGLVCDARNRFIKFVNFVNFADQFEFSSNNMLFFSSQNNNGQNIKEKVM